MSDLFTDIFKESERKKYYYTDKQKDQAGHALKSIHIKVLGADYWKHHNLNNDDIEERKHKLIDWNLIRELSIVACGSSPRWQDDKSGQTALHIVLSLHPPEVIVAEILALWPQASLVQDRYGCTPLHYACQYNASPSVVLLLLQSYRCAAQLHDIMGDMPIHIACSSPLINYEIVQILLDSDPHHVASPNNGLDEKTPLEILCDYFQRSQSYHRSLFSKNANQNQWNKLILCLWASHHGNLGLSSPIIYGGRKEGLSFHACLSQQCCSSSILYLMAKLYLKQSARIQDEYDNFPLIYAVSDCRKKEVLDHIIISLLGEFPFAASYPSKKNDQMPLHLAIINRRSLACIHHLVMSCPAALRKKDPESSLLPFMMTAEKSIDDLDGTFTLLRLDPNALQATVEKGDI